MSKSKPAIPDDWASANPSENMAMIPTMDRLRNILPLALSIQVAELWVQRKDGTKIDAKELWDNQTEDVKPVRIQLNLVVADDRQAHDVNAATFLSDLQDALSGQSTWQDLQDVLVKYFPGFTPQDLLNVQGFMDRRGGTLAQAYTSLTALA